MKGFMGSLLPALSMALEEKQRHQLELVMDANEKLSKVIDPEILNPLKKSLEEIASRTAVEYTSYKGQKAVAIIIRKKEEAEQ